jgi:hypothetical protein
MKRILFLTCSLALAQLAIAQNETDVLRYSRIGFGGTARFSAMGGAFGALGGDASIMSVNPAGMGLYHKNEFVFTPSLFSQNVISTYNGSVSEDSRYKLRFDNFGLVFGGRTENTEATGWQTVGLGIGYNRYASFSANLLMTGKSSSSLMDSWRRTASGVTWENLDQFNEQLGYYTWLLNPGSSDPSAYTDTIPDGDTLMQTKTIGIDGGMGEWVFSLGGNFSDKFYIGGSIGVPQVRYEEMSTFSEEEVHDSVSTFHSYQFEQSLITKGKGVNFKFGVIYRPIDLIRIGVAIHSPTFLRLSDQYSSKMTSSFDDATYHEQASPEGTYNYNIRTPMRLIGSLAFIFGKTGTLSADFEFVDYSDARLSAPDYSFITANNAIRNKYIATSNVHVGGELRILPFVVRGGFAWYGSPYNSLVNNSASRFYYTGGFGYRSEDETFYVDAAVVFNNEVSNYYFYDQSLVNPVENKWKSVNTMITMGFRY